VLREKITIRNGRVLESNYTGYEEKYLYVNGSGDNYVNLLPDGTLTNGKLFIDLSKETGRGVTDGMRVDTKGNLYETGPGGVWIISPEGKHLGTIRAPEQATNVAFGAADKKTLYIAAHRHLPDQGEHTGDFAITIGPAPVSCVVCR